jgi:hypothetical protein
MNPGDYKEYLDNPSVEAFKVLSEKRRSNFKSKTDIKIGAKTLNAFWDHVVFLTNNIHNGKYPEITQTWLDAARYFYCGIKAEYEEKYPDSKLNSNATDEVGTRWNYFCASDEPFKKKQKLDFETTIMHMNLMFAAFRRRLIPDTCVSMYETHYAAAMHNSSPENKREFLDHLLASIKTKERNDAINFLDTELGRWYPNTMLGLCEELGPKYGRAYTTTD